MLKRHMKKPARPSRTMLQHSTSSPLKTAVIGCGNFARHQHLPNINLLQEMELIAACDKDPRVAEKTARDFGAGYATGDIRKILEDCNIEAVVIAVNDQAQAEVTIQALEAGKHVYVEKPVAGTEEDFGKIIAARDRYKRKVAVGFNKRFAPIYQDIKRHLNTLGGPLSMHLRMADDAWRWAANYPGGSLLRHDVCHLFDLARWLSGEEADWILATSARDDEDAILMQLKNRTVATITNSGHASMDFPKERFEATVERGALMADDYVELRCFGYEHLPHTTFYAGRTTEDAVEQRLTADFAKNGLRSMIELRRRIWQARLRMAEGSTSIEDKCLAGIIPNFTRNQGWLESLKAFARALLSQTPLPHASVEDARIASRLVDMAVDSRARGMIIHGSNTTRDARMRCLSPR
jgi:predicted dehydrogenase